MADQLVKPETEAHPQEVPERRAISAQDWQFFAFVFGALVTLAFGVLDSLPPIGRVWAVCLKVNVFLLLAMLILWCWPVKRFLLRLLPSIASRTSDSRDAV